VATEAESIRGERAGLAPAGREPALRLEGVEKRFPGVHALKNVSLEVERGTVHAIVGENGAGKSTLMAVTAGVLPVDSGTVTLAGTRLRHADPEAARDLGLAVVYQEPALVPDLTVVENVLLGLPARVREAIRDPIEWTAEILAPWRPRSALDPRDHVRDLAPDQRFIVEIARALAEEPRLLVLDEPTEHLPSEDVEKLFAKMREVTARGGTVIYISHRIPEVLSVADRITVLRDGSITALLEAEGVTEGDIVARIVGRELESRFPEKADSRGETRLVARGLRGNGLDGVDLELHGGEIVGLAGIDGQGQRDLLRAIAGLAPARGEISIDGRPTSLRSAHAAHRAGINYVPGDRHAEGIFPALTVRENLTVGALDEFARVGVVRGGAEREAAERSSESLHIKAPDLETSVASLSGGNQQKAVLARALLNRPGILLADEPTQSVDVGARAEIYEILRDSARAGATVLVTSSDNAELAGLCDRVLVFSRGKVIDELGDRGLSEEAIAHAVLTSTAASRHNDAARRRAGWRRLIASDRAPAGVIGIAIVALAVWAASADSGYLSSTNVTSILTLFAALAFIALGQQLVMLTGGIDLSVGPLTGFLVVLASFQLSEQQTSLGLAIGALVVIPSIVLVGLVNWSLVWHLRINPMIATLITYMALQGVSLLLRPEPGGSISGSLTEAANASVGAIPIAAIVALVLGLGLELGLARARWGWSLRAVGSDQEAARRVGVAPGRMLLITYVGCALLTGLGAVMLMGQVGSGDPNSGLSYTFASIAAVVLGGASIFGGRGSFIGALAGALLVVQINTVSVFVGLSDAWQLYLLGGLTLIAAGVYSRTRAVR
jgi:ribose transport system ATP-binding protein